MKALPAGTRYIRLNIVRTYSDQNSKQVHKQQTKQLDTIVCI